MPQLPLPSEPTNELMLADWVEILALISPDENASKGDLESALKTASVLETKGDSAVEEKCLQVFNELEQRAIAADNSYPFTISGGTVTLKQDRNQFLGYVFCLFLSYFRWKSERHRDVGINPWLLFEDLCSIAAKNYVDGKVITFGTSRGQSNKAIKAFRTIVNQLGQDLGEGGGFREQSIKGVKDDKVDLVAWRDFKDEWPSKLVLFGQCAAGADWLGKDRELAPQSFWDQWMSVGKVSEHLRSFYMPHRVKKDHWNKRARRTGLLFDRCRIAYWTFQDRNAVLSDPRYKKWCDFVLKHLT
jgi:hypothetical protein